MPPLDSKKTYRNFCKKGFIDAKHKSHDHKRLEFWYDGKLTRCGTMFSHNGEEIGNYLIGQMSKQIGLDKVEFVDFAQCRMNQTQYEGILLSKNIIEKATKKQ